MMRILAFLAALATAFGDIANQQDLSTGSPKYPHPSMQYQTSIVALMALPFLLTPVIFYVVARDPKAAAKEAQAAEDAGKA